MIITTSTYTGVFFGRNSVILDFRLSTLANNVKLTVNVAKKSCETGVSAGSSSFQMSVVPITITSGSLYSYVCDLTDLMPVDGCYVYEITGTAEYASYSGSPAGTLFSFGIILLNSGVSKADFTESYLQSHYLNLPTANNWLFLTKGFSRIVEMYESEYVDFYFATSLSLLSSTVFDFTAVSNIDGTTVTAGTVTKVYEATYSTFGRFALYKASLTIEPVYWRTYYINYKRTGSAVTSSVQIKFLADPVCETKNLIYYRNSFGYMEAFLCYGLPMSRDYEFSDSDNYEFINSDGIQESGYAKPSVSESILINTGYCDAKRSLILKDVLLSNECYIIYESAMRRCKVTCENYSIALDKTPKNYQLKIDMLNVDYCASPVSVAYPLLTNQTMDVVMTENVPALISAQ